MNQIEEALTGLISKDPVLLTKMLTKIVIHFQQ